MKNINQILEIFKPTKSQKISKIFGIIALFLGITSLVVSFILGERYLNSLEELSLLFLGMWLFIYGTFATITTRGIWSLYLPTISMLIILFLPCITAAFTYKLKEWILILSTCIAVIISMVFFSVFLYFTVTKPMKHKNRIINQYNDYFISKSLIMEDGTTYGVEFINKNGDVATIVNFTYNKNGVILEKNVNGDLIYVTHKSFVEHDSAKFYAYNFLITLENKNKED